MPGSGVPHGKDGAGATSRSGEAAYQVLSQLRPLYQASERAVNQSLAGTDLTVALRAVLELLSGHGPLTVPQVAQDFNVTRQSIQALVDTGAAQGLFELKDNPRHRRSRHVTVTDHGRRTFADVHRSELTNLGRVTADLDPDELAQCARVLAVLTERVRRLHDRDHAADLPPDDDQESA